MTSQNMFKMEGVSKRNERDNFKINHQHACSKILNTW